MLISITDAKIQKHAFRFWQRFTTQKKLKYSKLSILKAIIMNCLQISNTTIDTYSIVCSYTFIGTSARHLPRGALNSKPHKRYSSCGARSLSRRRAGVRQELESRSCTRLRVLRAVFAEWRLGAQEALQRFVTLCLSDLIFTVIIAVHDAISLIFVCSLFLLEWNL